MKPLSRTLCTAPDPCRRRVVVTGMGIVSCLGLGVQRVWNKLLNGDSGIIALTEKEFAQLPSTIGGPVPVGKKEGEFDPEKFVSKEDRRGIGIEGNFALNAAHEAIEQSGWKPLTEEDKCMTGVSVGCAISGLEEMIKNGSEFMAKGYRRVSPFVVPKSLINLPAAHITFRYGYKGVNHAVSTACTTGAHSIGDAFRFIKYGDANVMVCGGIESSVSPYYMALFCRLRALATKFNDNPTVASRPFDKDREGFVMSEGAALLVLEELEQAKARGATIHGEILGYGLSGDAFHMTAPLESGEGGMRCMKNAMKEANVNTEDVGHVNAHATSTPLGDLAESRAIQTVMGAHTQNVVVTSTKGATGHLLGATGSLEAIFTLMACETGLIPRCLNCENPDEEIRLNIARNTVEWQPNASGRRVALTNSFGFGGTNGSLCVANYVE